MNVQKLVRPRPGTNSNGDVKGSRVSLKNRDGGFPSHGLNEKAQHSSQIEPTV
jgi:hypothetical protein